MTPEQDLRTALILGSVFLLFALVHLLITSEFIYGKFFHKPFFVHFYVFPKTLTDAQQLIIHNNFQFYRSLSQKRKKYFEYRVAHFIRTYNFYGRENLEITDEMKVLIAGTSTMLTFGMRNPRYKVFDKIILYPDIYFSEQNETYHKGEFNPKLKALVFSWKHFKDGLEVSNDNLNLGLHEFSHTLHFQSVKTKTISANIYVENFQKLKRQLADDNLKEKIIHSHYFRRYAFTNEVEFIAVILENFFETPEVFKREFPELYLHVKRMINYRES
ncbi:zinc-dependent peptidase [Flavobacterium sp. H122]|uniref:zinc-dependent peptidase n=1 Tax=Flavobacterium sp. H122 TaxID=2529860 RepID=UPI0010A9F7A1|nr:zinc-dependent peptidase [Flavobacterium sp. H122]